jgi:hypothetical protein
MPCGCKKGSGVSFRGGGMSIRGGGVRKRKRRRKKRGGALIGADPRTWAPTNSSTNRYAGLGGRSAGFRSASLIGRKRGSGWRSAVSAYVARKRGSGMGFSGAGMAFHGAGLRTGRLFLRRGTGRRMI